MPKETYTLGQALEHLLRLVPHLSLADNVAVIGPTHRHLNVCLDTSSTMGRYDTLALTLYADDRRVKNYQIDLTDTRFRPKNAGGPKEREHVRYDVRRQPDQEGGFWWAYDGTFLGWEPSPAALARAVLAIVNYHDIRA